MTRIIVSEDCGNSPKNIFIEKLTAAFAKRDAKFILGNVTDDICWNIVGGQLVEGKDNLGEALERMKNEKVAELSIRHITTHGKAGAVDGTVILEDGKTRAFCDVYEFNGAKGTAVKEITSYVIDIR
ncbi:MAG TPA: nuclear transport factor 2 family protein [Anaerolineales bacterium]|nr:nuclear transport factor 2 family protein [Anaerolineales bacterium]